MSNYMFVIPGEEFSFPFYPSCAFSKKKKKKKNLDGNFVLAMKTKHLYNVIILANNHFFFHFLNCLTT